MTIRLPWPPRALWPNGRPHWAQRARTVETARTIARVRAKMALQCLGEFARPAGWIIRVSAYPPPRSRPDDDGVLGAVKAYRDGIADALGVDDGCFRIGSPPVVIGERLPGGGIVITMEARDV